MIRVGVTGGIGSGKSTVCKLFAERGVPVYDSDSRARELTDGEGDIRRAIVELLGPEAYRGDRLDNAWVADKVFADRLLLSSLNAIIHPAVALDFEAWALSFADRPYVVLESAILLESGFDRFVDKIVAVSAPEEVRVERVLERDGRNADGEYSYAENSRTLNREDVLRRMANQLTDADRASRADITIDNGGTLAELAAQVEEIDNQLKQ